MEDSSYIKYTRALHTDEKFKSLSYQYRHIFVTILVNMAFKPIQLNDHGYPIDLLPGQLLTTHRELQRLCGEKDIDKSKIERALRMFEKIGFSRQETRHTKTIITITEPSICNAIKIENEAGFETRSRQDRAIKEERKEIKEEHTHMEMKKVVGGGEVISFSSYFDNPRADNSFKKPSFSEERSDNVNHVVKDQSFKENEKNICQEERKIELKQKFGEEELVELTFDEHRKLLTKHLSGEEEFNYWVREVEIERIRKGEKEYRKNNKSDYMAILAFKRYRESKPNFSPPYKQKDSKDSNQEENLSFAKKSEETYSSEYYEIQALSKHVEFVPKKGSCASTITLYYNANGFKDQFRNLLLKKGFVTRI